ncbi:MAG: amino acid racemase [Phenylobacterium sp.]|uniref:aspartate/glutamate racemase family protein n=1 Tax=Phenylobacterium sp. TaxID=1871053 RepID=UPI001A3BB817|nr:amino acid racemase [Phenylobacterium sp.]MBL8556175.1 amino acid racemase [Phenylobacterium sp.]
MSAPKTVGILGGMGHAAAIDLMARIHRLTPRTREQDGIRLIVDSNPATPDGNDALLRGGPSPAPMLAAMARGLETRGAEFVAMASSTAHAFQFDIERAIGVPFVSMIEEAGAALAARAPGPGTTIGLLAAEGCLHSGLYQSELARRGLSSVVPEGAARDEFMDLLHAIGAGDTGPRSTRRLAGVGARLARDGATLLLAACTEASLVLTPETAPAPLIDAMEVLAVAVVDYALGRRALPPPFAWTETGPA